MKTKVFKIFSLILILFLIACTLDEPTPTPTDPPEETQQPEETAPPDTPTPIVIVHEMIPGDPTFLENQLITDCTIGMGVTPTDTNVILSSGCDIWDRNKIERPFDNEPLKTYYQASDISRAQFGYDETWIFAQVITYLSPPYESVPLDGTYGVELDFDLDARGDILILVSQPSSEWAVDGVQVWRDTNADNGGVSPMAAEETNPGDGYDELIFDQGIGEDPDLVWARISPQDPNIVQFAFKKELAGEKQQFSWLAWAGLIDFDPGNFEMVDTFATDELYTVDNTCSWTFNIPLQGLPGQCGVYTKPPKEGQSCPGAPASGCGNAWMGFYWDAAACQCTRCAVGLYWEAATVSCEIFN